jgi:hypothetical protein
MTDQPTSPYPAIILTHLRAFGEQEKQFARSVEFFRAHGLADIFERYPDVDALAYQICGDAFSTEVKGDFAGVIVAGEHDAAHPANREAKRLIDALALAEEALWTEDSLDLAVLARRTDENVEITVHDPSDDPASRLLELVEDGGPIPAGYTQGRDGAGKLPAGPITSAATRPRGAAMPDGPMPPFDPAVELAGALAALASWLSCTTASTRTTTVFRDSVVDRLAQLAHQAEDQYERVAPASGEVPTPAQGITLARLLRSRLRDPSDYATVSLGDVIALPDGYIAVRFKDGFEAGIDRDGVASS